MKAVARDLLAASDIEAPVEPLKVGSIGDRVYDALLARLISLRIVPGSRIAIDALVREFGVSQTTIHAALIRLESEGLVEKVHNISFSAAPMPTSNHFQNVFDMRLLLEPSMASHAAERMTPDMLSQLEELSMAMTALTHSDAKLAYGRLRQAARPVNGCRCRRVVHGCRASH